MSRVGRLPIAVPAGVDVSIDGRSVTVKGPKGSLSRELHPEIGVARDGDSIVVAATQDLEAADGERGVVGIEGGRLSARGADVDDPLALGGELDGGVRRHAVARIEHDRLRYRAEEREVLERHLRRAILSNRDAGVRAAELHVRP